MNPYQKSIIQMIINQKTNLQKSIPQPITGSRSGRTAESPFRKIFTKALALLIPAILTAFLFSGPASAEAPALQESQVTEMDGVKIHDSYFQYAQDYEWDDLYTLLILISKTSEYQEGYTPAFSIIRLNPYSDPFLFAGSWNKMTRSGDFTVYTTDNGYVYQLLQFSGTLSVSPSEESFYVNGKDRFTYMPHALLETTPETLPSDLADAVITDLTDLYLSTEEIGSYVQDLTR